MGEIAVSSRISRARSLPSPARETASNGGRRLTYQPALDGIRALAVSAVLAFHGGLAWARGGFLGVDAFFVLSGYLITSLLLNEWQATGRINLTGFWARRARRLLPAIFLVMVGIAVYAVVFAAPPEMANLRGDALATLSGVANWRPLFVDHVYYTPLRHTWSLAIEQQWYLFWPFVVIALLRLRGGSPRVLLGVAIALAAASALLMAWLHEPGTEPSRAYYGTDTRAQSLLVGGALAILFSQIGPVRGTLRGLTLQSAGLACAVAVGFAWLTLSINDAFLYHGGFLLLALGVGVVIAAAAQPKAGPLGRVLSLPPLRSLGIISYGVYLWHWPIFFVLTTPRTHLEGYTLFAVRVALTLLISVISYNVVEAPFRHGAFRSWRVSWALAPAGAMSLAVCVFLLTRGGGV